MDAVAFALRAEYEGHVDVELEDGSTETRPKFGGGLLAVGDGDFNVGETLEEGSGTIVVYAHDSRLIDLLEAYPALKRVAVPAGAEPINPYVRRSRDDLRLQASLRDLEGLGNASHDRLATALLAHDGELAAGVGGAEAAEEAVAAVTSDPSTPPVEETPPPEVSTLSTLALGAVLDADFDTFADARRVEVPAALEELRKRAAENDVDAKAALEARGHGEANTTGEGA